MRVQIISLVLSLLLSWCSVVLHAQFPLRVQLQAGTHLFPAPAFPAADGTLYSPYLFPRRPVGNRGGTPFVVNPSAEVVLSAGHFGIFYNFSTLSWPGIFATRAGCYSVRPWFHSGGIFWQMPIVQAGNHLTWEQSYALTFQYVYSTVYPMITGNPVGATT